MKYIAVIFAVLTSSLFAESPEVKITSAQPKHAGYEFSVVSAPFAMSGEASDVHWVVVAIVPPAKAATSKAGYVEIWKEKRFVFSSELDISKDFPISLRRQVPDDAILFTFKISSDAIPESWFSYQLPRAENGFDPVNCVVRLVDFLQPPKPTPLKPRG